MLDYNKIESKLNAAGNIKIKVAKYLKIPNSTFSTRLSRHNLTPDDVEKIAEFFGVSMLYFFDKEENDRILVEPEEKYNSCPNCELKQAEINRLKADNEVLQKKYTSCLEDLLGKKNVC